MKIKKIEFTKEIKPLTLDDFLKLKKTPPFSDYRQAAKSINFGFLFGRSANSFAETELELSWDEKTVDEYIDKNNLKEELDKLAHLAYSKEEFVKIKYKICAADIRRKFFKTYPGLQSRIDREKEFAFVNGYIQSYSGHCRKFPELRYMILDGKFIKENVREYGAMISNIISMIANATIQNMEAVLTMSCIVELHNWLKANNMKTFIFNTIHDSIMLCVHKSEKDIVCEKLKEVCERPREPHYGLKQEIEIKSKE